MRWSSAPSPRWKYVGRSILAEAGSQEREHEWKEALYYRVKTYLPDY
jgi:hypothetical protein